MVRRIETNGNKDIATDEGQKRFAGLTRLPDYTVPAGEQLTESLIEEIAEGARLRQPEESENQ